MLSIVMGGYTLRFQWQIQKYSLQQLKGPGLISASPLNINKRLKRHTRTRATIL